jgi:nucleotide-binding universal stress UspA family protein
MSAETTRVLVLFEPNASGRRALLQGVAATIKDGAELTVVTLAPRSPPARGCAPSAQAYDCSVRDQAELELAAARELAGAAGARASFQVLTGGLGRPLTGWAANQRFELMLLPRHRFARGGHPAARSLRQATGAEVRLVG